MRALQTTEHALKTTASAAGFGVPSFYVLYRTLESMRVVVNLQMLRHILFELSHMTLVQSFFIHIATDFNIVGTG